MRLPFSKQPDSFTAYKEQKESEILALQESNASLATNNSELSAKLEAFAASSKIKAEEDAQTDSAETTLITAILNAVAAYHAAKAGTADSTDDSSDSDSDSDSQDDGDTDDSNDADAKASKVDLLKSLSKSVSHLIAETKAVKASVADEVIKQISAIGIPTPIATKVEGQRGNLTPKERISAAFAQQLNQNK